MPELTQLLTELRQNMSAELTRSDVLRSLIWPIAGLLFAIPSATAAKSPTWILISLVGMLGVFMLLYIVAYIFFAVTDSDALRSEKYKLHKMAIEHGLYGDSSTGLRTIDESEKMTKAIDVTPTLNFRDD